MHLNPHNTFRIYKPKVERNISLNQAKRMDTLHKKLEKCLAASSNNNLNWSQMFMLCLESDAVRMQNSIFSYVSQAECCLLLLVCACALWPMWVN